MSADIITKCPMGVERKLSIVNHRSRQIAKEYLFISECVSNLFLSEEFYPSFIFIFLKIYLVTENILHLFKGQAGG